MITTLFSLYLVSQADFFDVYQAQRTAKLLQPELTEYQAEQIALAVVNESERANLPWDKFMAILFQESSLKLDPKNCRHDADTCTGDYGLGQVNFPVWGEDLNINKHKMMTNYFYSIRKSAEVFNKYYALYAHKDPNWWSLYHSKTPSLKREYQRKVKRVHDKILKELEEDQNEPGFNWTDKASCCISR